MAALPAVALELNSAAAQLLLMAAREPTHENIRLAFLLPFTRQDINHALWLLTVERPEPTLQQVARLIGWGAQLDYAPEGELPTLRHLFRMPNRAKTAMLLLALDIQHDSFRAVMNRIVFISDGKGGHMLAADPLHGCD